MTQLYLRVLLTLFCLIVPCSYSYAEFYGEDGRRFPDVRLNETLLPSEKISGELKALSSIEPEVTVIIIFANQPGQTIVDEVQAEYENTVEPLQAALKQINSRYSIDDRGLNDEQLATLAVQQSLSISKKDKDAIRSLNQQLNMHRQDMRTIAANRTRQAIAYEQSLIKSLVEKRGGRILYSYAIINSLAVRIPSKALDELASSPLVARIIEDREMKPDLDTAAGAISAGSFWNGGFDGGIWENATCDTGVDTSHPSLDHLAWSSGVFHASGQSSASYDDNSASTDDLQGHGTHVAGIMGSNNATYKGISYGSEVSINIKSGYRKTDGDGSMQWTDMMAGADWGVDTAGADVVNFSFGETNSMVNDDDDATRFWDGLIHGRTITLSKSAGNNGSGASTLTSPSGTYNGIVVANVNNQGTLTRNDDVIAGGSSRGPTPNERKKPDIAAPGTSIMSTNNSWEGGNADFVSKTGTSMAAPMIGGAATLLHDAGVTDPRSVKAVLINTADFMGGNTTWAADWGWGYVNLNRAYTRRSNVFLHSVNPRNTAGEYRFYKVPSPVVGDKATMTWHRRVVYNNTNYPSTWYGLSDLNLRFYRESSNSSHDSSLSSIDNIEQVAANTTEPLVLKAYAWSTSFSGVTSETYALAVPPGTVTATGPSIAPTHSSSYSPPVNAKFSVGVRVYNTGDLAAHNCQITLTLPAGVSLVSGTLSRSVGSTPAGSYSDYEVFELKATTAGQKTVNVSVTSDSYGSDFSGASSFTINPGAADSTAPYSVLSYGSKTYRTGGVELMANGGFESLMAGWIASGAYTTETTNPSSGSRRLKLGPGTAEAYQTVSISNSATRAVLSFDYIASAQILAPAGCSIQSAGGTTYVTALSLTASNVNWTSATIDVTRFKGQTIRVRFGTVSGIFGDSTLYLDNVSLKEGETVYTGLPNASIRAFDSNAGLDYSQHALDGGLWLNSADITLTMDKSYNISYRSVDNSANVEPTIATYAVLDTTAPKSALEIGFPFLITGGSERIASNTGFESGFTGWSTSGTASVTNLTSKSGVNSAVIQNGAVYRDVAIPGGVSRAVMSAWIRTQFGSGTFASYSASVLDTETGDYVVSRTGNATSIGWNQIAFDLTRFAGKTVTLRFSAGALFGTSAILWVDDVSLKTNATTYVSPDTSLEIQSAELVGIDKHQYGINGAPLADGSSFTLATSGNTTVAYRGIDRLAWSETAVSTSFFVDGTAPTGSLQINNNAQYTTSTAVTLNISGSDTSGVTFMRFRNAGGVYGNWVPFANSHPWALTPGAGVKTVQMQLQDSLENLTADLSDTIELVSVTSPLTIGAARLLGPHPVGISLSNKIVSGNYSGTLYIQESNRSAGLRVNPGILTLPAYTPGRYLSVSGVLRLTANNEPELYLTEFTEGVIGEAPTPISALASRLGGEGYGSYIPGMFATFGLNNTGLLIRTAGRVVAQDVFNDRIEITDLTLRPNARVFVDYSQIAGALPAVGTWHTFTGNIGTVVVNARNHAIIRLRNSADVSAH